MVFLFQFAAVLLIELRNSVILECFFLLTEVNLGGFDLVNYLKLTSIFVLLSRKTESCLAKALGVSASHFTTYNYSS